MTGGLVCCRIPHSASSAKTHAPAGIYSFPTACNEALENTQE